MDYNSYYPTQPGHAPPSNHPQGGSNGGLQSSQHQNQPQQSHQMIYPTTPQTNTRQPCPPNNHQQLQQQQQHQHQHQHQQQTQQQSQQQQHIQHQNFQQLHPPHVSPGSHTSSTHPQQSHQQPTQHHHHNHQTNMTGPLPQQTVGSHHVHSQSPHHHGPTQPHLHPQQQLNQMIRPQMGPPLINHHQPSLSQSNIHHQQSFFGGGLSPQSGLHYPQQNHHHHHHHSQAVHQHMHHQPPLMHHGLPPPMGNQFPHHAQPGIGRNSPHFVNILQTELRILEFNRKLQCRPFRYPNNPLPSNLDEHSSWWDRFALEFFEDDATLTLRLVLEEKPVEYTIGRTLIPRFFRTYFDGGATDLSINLRSPREAFIHPHMITLDCDQAYIITNNIFKPAGMPSNHGIVVHTEGHLIIDFVNNFDSLYIKSWRFYTRRSHEYIDRAILTTLGLPNDCLTEPITRQGLTKSTISYLKMCMIMEPMQELMYHHKQTKMDPRSCLRKLLLERYKFRSVDDSRVATNKKRKRKSSAAPAMTAAQTTKRSKAGLNNSIGNNTGLNNNILMSPSSVSGNSFSLASQDVMIVGEPSMMGGDFGDDNERMITRLENTQYDPSVSAQSSNLDETANVTSTITNTNTLDSGNHIESSQNHSMSPSMIEQQRQNQDQVSISSASPQEQATQRNETNSQQSINSPHSQSNEQQPQQQALGVEPLEPAEIRSDPNQIVRVESPVQDHQTQPSPSQVQISLETEQDAEEQREGDNQTQQNNHRISPETIEGQDTSSKIDLSIEQLSNSVVESQNDETKQASPSALNDNNSTLHGETDDMPIKENNINHQSTVEEAKISLIHDGKNSLDVIKQVNTKDSTLENHSTKLLNDIGTESEANPQLICTSVDSSSTLDKNQPTNNGVTRVL